MKRKLAGTGPLATATALAALLAALLACSQPNQAPPTATLAASSSTPAPSATEPAATATQPAASATAVAQPSAASTGGADCANAYLPTSEGSTWTYSSSSSLTSGTGGRTVTTTKVGPDSFYHNVQLLKPPLHYEVSWQCTPEGLVEYGGGVLASLSAASKVKIDILKN